MRRRHHSPFGASMLLACVCLFVPGLVARGHAAAGTQEGKEAATRTAAVLRALLPGTACPDCNDFNACTVDTCDETTGTCRHDPLNCDDGSPCSFDICDLEGGCRHVTAGPRTPCDDGNSCTTTDICGLAGLCAGQQLPAGTVCDEGNTCSVGGACDGEGRCTGMRFVTDGPCDDHDACTSGDHCVATDTGAACVGSPRDCADADLCTHDICNAATGLCEHPPLNCYDGNTCTTDTCDPATGHCRRDNLDGGCSTGNICSAGGMCVGGNCVSTGNRTCFGGSCCDDGNMCTVEDHCEAGACMGDPMDCDDGNPCTADGCGAQGCSHVVVPAPLTCGVGACARTVDTCSAGVPQPCVPGDPAPEICNGIDDDCDGPVDEDQPALACTINPAALGVQARGSTFSVTCDLRDACGFPMTGQVAAIDRAWIGSADRADDPFDDQLSPDPGTVPCPDADGHGDFERGISENLAARNTVGTKVTFMFNVPADGRCATLDGDRGDVIDRLAGLGDGDWARICVATRVGGVPMEGCGAVVIKRSGHSEANGRPRHGHP